MNDKVNELYDKFIDEFLIIKSSRDNVSKYNLETNILTLHRRNSWRNSSSQLRNMLKNTTLL